MQYGITVQLHLRNGTTTGIRHAEIDNRTVQAVACPQTRMDHLKSYVDASEIDQLTGVYFLVGHDDTGRLSTYIGSAIHVTDRIFDHHYKGDLQDLWYESVFFVNKDDNLSESDIRYLEARLCDATDRAGRYAVWNDRRPNRPDIPLTRKKALNEWFELIRVMLGTLGHDILQPLRGPCPGVTLGDGHDTTACHTVDVFELAGGDFSARGTPTHDGFTVFKGSLARVHESDGLDDHYKQRRATLLTDGAFEQDGPSYRFTRDVRFSSSSAAASAVAGTRRSGPESWTHTTTHTSLADTRRSPPTPKP